MYCGLIRLCGKRHLSRGERALGDRRCRGAARAAATQERCPRGSLRAKGRVCAQSAERRTPAREKDGRFGMPAEAVLQNWDPLRRTESEGGRDLHSWHPARPPVRRNESLGGCLGGRRVLFVCMFGSASVCRAARAGGGLAVSASPLSNPAVAAPARAARRRAAGSVPPMLLIGVSTAHSHHNHQLTDARA